MRKKKDVPITQEGRDKGKIFTITEMDALDGERWAIRLLLGLAKSGVEVPENIAEAGMAGVATLGIRALAGLPFDIAEPLLAEMLGCVKIKPDPNHPELEREILKQDFEEISTIIFLRKEVLQLHVNFSITDGLSTLGTKT